MSIGYKGSVIWAVLMTFLNLLMFRIDGKITWNWFLIFTPMWILDFLLLFSAFAQLSGRSNRIYITEASGRAQALNLVFISFKILLELLICLRLEVFPLHIRFVHLLAPLLPLLTVILVALVAHIRRIVCPQEELSSQDDHNSQSRS